MEITVKVGRANRTYRVISTHTAATLPNLFTGKSGLVAIHIAEGVRGATVEIWEYANGSFSIL